MQISPSPAQVPAPPAATRSIASILYRGSGDDGVDVSFRQPALVATDRDPAAVVDGSFRDAINRAVGLVKENGGHAAPSYGIEQVRDGVYELRPFGAILRYQGLPGVGSERPVSALRESQDAVALVGRGIVGYNWIDLRDGEGDFGKLPWLPGVGAIVR